MLNQFDGEPGTTTNYDNRPPVPSVIMALYVLSHDASLKVTSGDEDVADQLLIQRLKRYSN